MTTLHTFTLYTLYDYWPAVAWWCAAKPFHPRDLPLLFLSIAPRRLGSPTSALSFALSPVSRCSLMLGLAGCLFARIFTVGNGDLPSFHQSVVFHFSRCCSTLLPQLLGPYSIAPSFLMHRSYRHVLVPVRHQLSSREGDIVVSCICALVLYCGGS